MKRHLHLLLLLLSLTLPVNGVAGLLALSQACPMERQDMSVHDIQASCCENQAEQPTNGKVCKTGQECKSNGMLQVSVTRTPALFNQALATPSAQDFPPPTALSGFWRPPRV
ncbi:hypothetical protein [Pseudomonas aeruginosa]|uniref:hypothetical protein n=1 Tax=Pseudomonas aeruginosa TaxID=287 RepID=UPI0027C2427C|nr:hypothetical protein [Pseudomonas aeruginosa]MDQ2578877.1 hypothetical protein [Pseudomonas aeruginosa]MDQ2605570.1 hypothetical protein [Pseudomonas aeruginosa]MDT8189522.1 hypothetical protein [Pseudomonas aeruginosa]MDT8211656.1 hypothetical protein [Pseudomonas aeruginosa]HBP6529874.1 hypothetical protein [Pseudomonas aeruginosa]